MPAKLHTNRYGKSRVRLMRLTKHASHHDLDEWTVQILLTGDFTTAHTLGDNSQILPTDTMKNTVYFVARESKADSMEAYAQELVDYILTRNPQVTSAEVVIESTLWKRLTVDGKPFPTAFMRGSEERQTTTVARAQNSPFTIKSGLDRLTLLKTANSAFTGYIKDSLTTLPETTDRLFGTALKAEWPYTPEGISAGIDFLMPNKHNLLVDLARFGQSNPNQIFVPTDEPHGTIEATIRRA
jgi:urate oxidase